MHHCTPPRNSDGRLARSAAQPPDDDYEQAVVLDDESSLAKEEARPQGDVKKEISALEEEADLGAESGGKLRSAILTGFNSPEIMAAVRTMAIICVSCLFTGLRSITWKAVGARRRTRWEPHGALRDSVGVHTLAIP